MTAPRTAPAEDRAARRVMVARMLARSALHHGVFGTVVAAAIGVGESYFRRLLDPSCGDTISLADVFGLPKEMRVDVAAELARSCGLELVETHTDDTRAHVARLAVKSHEAVSALALAAADGHVTPDEGADLARVGRELSAQGQTLVRLGEQAVRERGVRIEA